VDAPVKRTTDQRGQQTQYDLEEYAQNAGDGKAKPVLDPSSQIWPPGAGDQGGKKANATTALRYVKAAIDAGLRVPDPWRLAAQAQKMSRGIVVDRTRLLEAIAEANATRARSARRRTASRTRACSAPLLRYGGANTTTTDWALFV
jgi:hypothetical protein